MSCAGGERAQGTSSLRIWRARSELRAAAPRPSWLDARAAALRTLRLTGCLAIGAEPATSRARPAEVAPTRGTAYARPRASPPPRWICGPGRRTTGRRRAWRLRRAKTLLKLLVLAPDRRLHREQLDELLWPDARAGRHGFHQVLYTARRALGAGSTAPAPRRVVARWGRVGRRRRVRGPRGRARAPRRSRLSRGARAVHGASCCPRTATRSGRTPARGAARDASRPAGRARGLQAAAADGAGGGRDAAARGRRGAAARGGAPRADAPFAATAAASRRSPSTSSCATSYAASRRRPRSGDARPYRELLAGEHEPARDEPTCRASSTSFVGRERELAELGRLLAAARGCSR